MKIIFPAVFESVWKRKETRIFLAFTFLPLLYLVASFFGDSNFMQISIVDGYKVGYLSFLDMMVNSADSFMLPILALYFLTISVFKREADDHTLFLYKDLNRSHIFWSKYISLLLILLIYVGIFSVTALVVHYGRVVHLDFGSARLFEDTLHNTLVTLFTIGTFILKGIFSISVATLLCLYFGNGTTLTAAVFVTIALMLMGVIGGPLALLLPNGYRDLAAQGMSEFFLALLGAMGTTVVYSVLFSTLAGRRFRDMEF